MDSLTENHNYFKPSLLVIELLRKAVIAQNRVASFTGFRMKRTIVSVNEGKHSLGGVSCSKQQQTGDVQDSVASSSKGKLGC